MPKKVCSCNTRHLAEDSVLPLPRAIALPSTSERSTPSAVELASLMKSRIAAIKPARARCRVVAGLPNLGVEHGHHRADDVARRAELAQLASGLDAFEQVFKQVAFGVGIVLVQAQVIHLADDLGQHHRLVNHQPRAVHKVDGVAACHFGVERKHFVPQKARQVLRPSVPVPSRPAKALTRHGAAATHHWGIQRVT